MTSSSALTLQSSSVQLNVPQTQAFHACKDRTNLLSDAGMLQACSRACSFCCRSCACRIQVLLSLQSQEASCPAKCTTCCSKAAQVSVLKGNSFKLAPQDRTDTQTHRLCFLGGATDILQGWCQSKSSRLRARQQVCQHSFVLL